MTWIADDAKNLLEKLEKLCNNLKVWKTKNERPKMKSWEYSKKKKIVRLFLKKVWIKLKNKILLLSENRL